MKFLKLRNFPLLPRPKNADKSHFGHALILAGSKGMMGAGALATKASLASGAGLVTWGLPHSFSDYAFSSTLEAMRLELAQTAAGSLDLKAYSEIMQFIKLKRINACALGPGFSTNPRTIELTRKLVRNLPVAFVLDGDGLNSFKSQPELLRHVSPAILTPHQREFERIFGQKWPESLTKRAELAKKLSAFYDVTLVLKGNRTLVVSGEKAYRNLTGNPGMAKGGSGDVLTGIITAFLAQGLKPFEATCWAVYFHGLAGDIAVKEKSQLSLKASDLIEFLPKALLK